MTIQPALDDRGEVLCEDLFERLADVDPARLVALLASDMSPTMLTFAAEFAGRVESSETVVPALLRLLEHAEPVVREGAVYGLGRHAAYPGVLAALKVRAERDPSPGVREAAGGAAAWADDIENGKHRTNTGGTT